MSANRKSYPARCQFWCLPFGIPCGLLHFDAVGYTGKPSRLQESAMKTRGIYEKFPGSCVWWIRYVVPEAACGARRQALRAQPNISIASASNKRSRGANCLRSCGGRQCHFARSRRRQSNTRTATSGARNDHCRMEKLLSWFGERAADSITPQMIEERFHAQTQSPATANRHRALLSLTYRLAIRGG
jgi:hypothetical protein